MPLIDLSMLRAFLIASLLFACFLACTTEEESTTAGTADIAPSTTIPNSLHQLGNDMVLAHEAIPRGVPDHIDWSSHPRPGYGNKPPEDWSAMITWGQVYAAAGHSAPPNTRFQLKNLRTWYLSKGTGDWTNWQHSSQVGGANYAEDFQNDVNVPADIRVEDEGASATLQDGYNFHFWPQEGRVAMNASDIEAVWSAIDGRLILADSSRTDDRADARLLLSAGSDYWLSPSAPWDQWKTNGDIGIGRFRFLSPDWQTYNMHTISDSIFRVNPPPFDR